VVRTRGEHPPTTTAAHQIMKSFDPLHPPGPCVAPTEAEFGAALKVRLVSLFRAPDYQPPLLPKVALELLKAVRRPNVTFSQSLRQHSVFVAEMARLVSRQCLGFDDYAYLCGLLHDVGSAAAIVAIAGPSNCPEKPTFAQLWSHLEPIHAECGQLVAKCWGLPPETALVIAQHHMAGAGAPVHPLANAVALADALAPEVGLGFETETRPRLAEQLAAEMGLRPQVLKQLRERAVEIAVDVTA
jgi:putative nucleotidyltransferase with HDIG domain